MENKKNLINVLIIIASIVSAVLTIKFALGIVDGMLHSEVGFLKTNPMPLVVCLTIGGAISFFLLGRIKKIFITIAIYYIGMLLSITFFYYAFDCILFNIGIEYIVAYTVMGIIFVALTVSVAKTFK